MKKTAPIAKILKEPNTTTKKAIAEVRKGKTHKAQSLEQLFADLKK